MVPLFIISIAKEKVIDVIVNMPEVSGGHGFESLWRYTGEARSFGVLELLYCLAKFILGDWIIEFPKSLTLGYLVKEGWVSVAVIVVDLIEMGGGKLTCSWRRLRHVSHREDALPLWSSFRGAQLCLL
jgi:hypothetical protein